VVTNPFGVVVTGSGRSVGESGLRTTQAVAVGSLTNPGGTAAGFSSVMATRESTDPVVVHWNEAKPLASVAWVAVAPAPVAGSTHFAGTGLAVAVMSQSAAGIKSSVPGSGVRSTYLRTVTDGAHNWSTTRTLRRGDILSLNCFPMIAGYYTALERTLFWGEPSPEHLRLWEVNVKVHRRGLELIKPGAVCKDIAAELNEIFDAEGLLANRTFGYGHSFGVLSHYYGREAGLELREDIETVLEPGMVVSMEPMIMVPEGRPGAGGYREHDILVVGEDGAENITTFPFGPEHNILGV